MADKKSENRKPFNFLNESPIVRQTEQTVVEGFDAIERKDTAPSEGNNVQVADDSQQASSLRSEEPTKGVQANLPISLYNRMKRLKFETDESFQSMFQRAMDLFLDVEEGKMKVTKAT